MAIKKLQLSVSNKKRENLSGGTTKFSNEISRKFCFILFSLKKFESLRQKLYAISIMAAGSVLFCSRKIVIFLVIYLLMSQLKPHTQVENHLGHILVGSNLDVKPTYSRNSGPRHGYSKVDKLPSTCKVSKLLSLTESSLLVLSFILLAGDINPQPGPGNVFDVPTLNFKARGLSVIHLNVRSLIGKMDQLRYSKDLRFCKERTSR